MTTNMKLIFENYRRGMLFEEEGPQSVGDLVKTIEAHILANSDRLKRVCQSLVAALEAFGEAFPDQAKQNEKVINMLTEAFSSISEKGLKETIKEYGAKKLTNLVMNIVNLPAVKEYLLKKVGKATVEFVVKEMLPLVGSLIKFAKWIYKLFKVGKEVKNALESSSADPNKAFAMIVKDVMTAEDNKETTAGFLGLLNIDDEWQKMLDNKVEMEFIKDSIDYIRTLDPDTSVENLNLNQRLVDFLKQKFDGRTLAKQ